METGKGEKVEKDNSTPLRKSELKNPEIVQAVESIDDSSSSGTSDDKTRPDGKFQSDSGQTLTEKEPDSNIAKGNQ